MQIRIESTPDEAAVAASRIRTVLDVRQTSRFYPNRGDSRLGRIYLTVADPPAGFGPVRARAERTDQTWNRLQRAEHRDDLTAENEWGPA